jgi:hypothetical protein
MPADLTEVEVESANTLAQDDYQIKALLHNNQPSTSAYRVKPNYAGAQLVSDEMWLDWLLYLDGDGKAVVVHHYIEGTDGLDAITGETPVIDAAYAISLDDADNLNMVRPVNWSKVIAKQQALTGLPNTVAALVHRSFSRIDQALLDGEADFHADLTPMNVGRMINLHVSGDWVARTGLASPWYCCLLGSEMNVIAEKMTLKLFIVGS